MQHRYVHYDINYFNHLTGGKSIELQELWSQRVKKIKETSTGELHRDI